MAADLFQLAAHGTHDADRRPHVDWHGRFGELCEFRRIYRNVARDDGGDDAAIELPYTASASNNLSKKKSRPSGWNPPFRSELFRGLDGERHVLLRGLRPDWAIAGCDSRIRIHRAPIRRFGSLAVGPLPMERPQTRLLKTLSNPAAFRDRTLA